MTTAIYTRLSSDPNGTSTACERQEADARQYAERHGWGEIVVYRDNDASAFNRRKKRPEFERLVRDIEAGTVERVIVWKSDRLARQPRDLERFLDALDGRATLASVTEPEFAGAGGLLILRMLVSFASHESAVKSERLQRKRLELADRGLDGGGPRPFGYRRLKKADGGGLIIERDEAQAIREAALGILAGQTTQSDVARHWTARGLAERKWTATTVLQVLAAPRLAGLRLHHGGVLGPATWEPILTADEHERVRVLAETRKKGKRETRAPYLLAGLARCGLCGRNLSARADGYYGCSKGAGGCGGVSVRRDFADAEVVRRFLEVVADPDVMERLEAPSTPDTAPLTEALRHAEDRVAEIAQAYGDGRLTFDEFRPAADAARERVEQTRQGLAAIVQAEIIQRPDRDAILARWDTADVIERRRWLSSVVREVAVLRSSIPSRRGFDKGRVVVGWRFPALMKIAAPLDGMTATQIERAEAEFASLGS